MTGCPMSGLPRKPYLTIELPAWKWGAVVAASPFVLMLAFKLSWETLYWWAQVVFAESETAQFFAGILMILSWIVTITALPALLIEGSIALKVKRKP